MRRWKTALASVLVLCTFAGCFGSEENAAPETTVVTMPEETILTEPTEPAKMDAARLLWEARKATKGRFATQYTHALSVDTRIGTSGISMRMGVEMERDVSMTNSPFSLFVSSKTNMIMADAEISESTQFYCRKEDSLLTAYMHLDSMDVWMRSQSEEQPSSLLRNYWLTGYPAGPGIDALTVAEEMVILDGREVYAMSYVVNGQDHAAYLYDALESFLGPVSLAGLDLSVVELPTTYYIDAQTFCPVQIVMEFHGIDQLIRQILQSQNTGMPNGDMVEPLVEINEYRLEIRNISYEEVEVPQVPEEGVKRSTEEPGILPSGGGSFAL